MPLVQIHDRVQSALVRTGLEFRVWRHDDLAGPVASPGDFARLTGIEIDRVTKTVLFQERSAGRRVVLANAPIRKRIDLKALAGSVSFGSLHLAPEGTLAELLDYPPSGVSPLGVPSQVPIVVDSRVLGPGLVTVGAGAAGVELELDPAALVRSIGAAVLAICSD